MSARRQPGLRDGLRPKQIAALKRQLQAANTRLIAIERERQQLKAEAAALAAILKRIDSGDRTP